MFPRPDEVEVIKKRYEGKRIRLIHMPGDPDPIQNGTKGTVEMVDGAGQLIVNWDNGHNLSLIPGIDQFEIIEEDL